MEAVTISKHTKRFVVEDSISRVTSDGEPHETMTMIAALSGFITALIILAIIIVFLKARCRNNMKKEHWKTNKSSIDNGRYSPSTGVYTIQSSSSNSPANPECNINHGFVESEINLSDHFHKGERNIRWSKEIAERANESKISVNRF